MDQEISHEQEQGNGDETRIRDLAIGRCCDDIEAVGSIQQERDQHTDAAERKNDRYPQGQKKKKSAE